MAASTISVVLDGLVALLLLLLCSTQMGVLAETEPADLAVLKALVAGVSNPPPDWLAPSGDPCGMRGWSHVRCRGPRVTGLQLQGAGLRGTLPSTLNALTALEGIALQGNFFTGALPSLSGLSQLRTAFLNDQQFTSIPSDFFKGLTSLTLLALEHSPLNATTGGWALPPNLAASCPSLVSLYLTNTTLSGPIPDSLGNLTSLQDLRLSYNRLSGGLPASLANLPQLSRLEVNNQVGAVGPLSGPIDVVASLPSLRTLWLQVNNFSGRIPAGLGAALSLEELRLNDNKLVGPIPATFASSSSLRFFSVQNNLLTGTIPIIPSITVTGNYTFSSGNHFCLPQPTSAACAPQVAALLSFLDGVNYPANLLSSWTGNNPCAWQGVVCDSTQSVIVLVLPRAQLSGTISPELAKIVSLARIVLSGNNLRGTIPASLTTLTKLVLVDVSNNHLSGPLPPFDLARVKVIVTGNPALNVTGNPALPPL